MYQQSAEEVLAEVIGRWKQGENKEKLGRELASRLDLQCEQSLGSYARQVAKLVNRRLKNSEKDVLNYFYDNLCSEGVKGYKDGKSKKSGGNLDEGSLKISNNKRRKS